MANKTQEATVPEVQREAWSAAINIVQREQSNWEEAIVYVTDKVAFRMRELIRIFRKNYWGVFDKPYDELTGREKTWIGLAMSIVEMYVKNGDIDQKDISFVARTEEGTEIADLTRLWVKEYLSRMYFGETLDEDQRQLCIDGTVVWKTWEAGGKMNRRTVDLLNFYIDPSEKDIQSAYRVTERSLLLPAQIAGMDWYNTKNLTGSNILSKTDGNRNNQYGTFTTGEFRDVWEMWGKIPKWLVTLDKEAQDAHTEIDGHVVISGLQSGQVVCHLIEENTRKDRYGNAIKPYEEWRIAKVSGRWYGIGIVERILALQEYLNTIVNVRKNKALVSQLGLFKIKKGKGITSSMLQRLPVNGAIQVQDMDDVQQFNVSDVPVSSYKDEDVIKYWAAQVTQAQPVSSGEILPASATATSAAISNANAKSTYVLFMEATGHFLTRRMDRQALPIMAKELKEGELLRLAGDDDMFKELMERVAFWSVMDKLENSPVVPSEEELNQVIEEEVARLRSRPQTFVKNIQKIVADSLEARVKTTNEDLDTSVTVKNLIDMAQIAPEYREHSVRLAYDLLGLPTPKAQQRVAEDTMEIPEGVGPTTPQREMTSAMVTQNMV